MHLTPEDLKKLRARWLSEGWNETVVDATLTGMQYAYLEVKGRLFLENSAGPETPTTPTKEST